MNFVEVPTRFLELIQWCFQAFIARGERIFKLDDVFMTGILAKEAGVAHRF